MTTVIIFPVFGARTLSRMPEKCPAGTMTGNVPAGDDGGTGRGDWTCSA